MHKKWYIENGEQGDIVLYSRVRISRNAEEYPFPCRLSAETARELNAVVINALKQYKKANLNYIRMSDLLPHSAISLAEKHLISLAFTEPNPKSILVLSDTEELSIMLCGEDHICIQAMQAGFSLDAAYALADSVDACLDGQIRYAFDENLGFLTQNPTGLGTAMRASVFLHLPALARNAELTRIAATVAKLGLSLRGAYGDGSNARGDIFVLSNELTLGISEKAALDNLKAVTLQLTTKERAAREEMIADTAVAEQIQKAYALLSSARMISANEMMDLITSVRLGAVYHIVPVQLETINELMLILQPATVNASFGEGMDSFARETLRADILRQRFAEDSFSA